MLVPFRPPSLLSPGMGIERVDRDSPLIKRTPLVIEVGNTSDLPRIIQKIYDYRTWFALVDGLERPAKPFRPFSDQTNPLQAAVQELYSENEYKDEESVYGIDSVTITFPKALQAEVDSMVLECPPHLLVYENRSVFGGGRAVHVSGKHGTKSLGLFLNCLDIEVEETSWYIGLNNPSNPGWVIRVPDEGPPISFGNPVQASQVKEENERTAWSALEQLFRSAGLDIEGDPYPNGPDRFPDYLARIRGEEVDVEITSVPNLEHWTIKTHYRDLEKMCRDLARRQGETKEEVLADLDEVILNKKTILRKQRAGGRSNRCVLVICNRSAVEIVGEDYWSRNDLSEFALVAVIERYGAQVVHV